MVRPFPSITWSPSASGTIAPAVTDGGAKTKGGWGAMMWAKVKALGGSFGATARWANVNSTSLRCSQSPYRDSTRFMRTPRGVVAANARSNSFSETIGARY